MIDMLKIIDGWKFRIRDVPLSHNGRVGWHELLEFSDRTGCFAELARKTREAGSSEAYIRKFKKWGEVVYTVVGRGGGGYQFACGDSSTAEPSAVATLDEAKDGIGKAMAAMIEKIDMERGGDKKQADDAVEQAKKLFGDRMTYSAVNPYVAIYKTVAVKSDDMVLHVTKCGNKYGVSFNTELYLDDIELGMLAEIVKRKQLRGLMAAT